MSPFQVGCSEYIACGFCGLRLPSLVSLSIHQMVVDTLGSCSLCKEWLDDDDERLSHVCQPQAVKRGDDIAGEDVNKRLSCPLGCPDTRRFDRDEMEAHLSTLHGWEEDSNVTEDGVVEVEVDPEMMSKCPMCRISLNVMTKSMLSHVFYQCNGRCKVLKETIKGLQVFAEVRRIHESRLC